MTTKEREAVLEALYDNIMELVRAHIKEGDEQKQRWDAACVLYVTMVSSGSYLDKKRRARFKNIVATEFVKDFNERSSISDAEARE